MRDQALNLLKIGDRLGAKPLELSIKTWQPLFLSDLPDPYHLSLQFYFIPPVNTYLMGPKSQVDAVEKTVCGCTIAPHTADKIQRNLSHKYERAGGSDHKNERCRPILHMLRQPIEHISCSRTWHLPWFVYCVHMICFRPHSRPDFVVGIAWQPIQA